MSEFHVEVIKVGEIFKHENADTLSCTMVHGGYPVVFRTGDYAEGDLAVYVPIDALVPLDNPKFAFLDKSRIRAKRLRGFFSMGMLVKSEPGWVEGMDVRELLGITRWTPAIRNRGGNKGYSIPFGGQRVVDFVAPVYDLEALRKYSGVIKEGEEVIVTEKLHGTNGRFVARPVPCEPDPALEGFDIPSQVELIFGSRNFWRTPEEGSVWAAVADQYDLTAKLILYPDVVFYGEVYGLVQDLTYSATKDQPYKLAIFDAFDLKESKWYSYDRLVKACEFMDLPMVPVLYKGPWDPKLAALLAEGNSTQGAHVREGFVIQPADGRSDFRLGRVKLKHIGQGYLLRGSDELLPDDTVVEAQAQQEEQAAK
jgi:RNA ligase (TIGR02306 family)